MEIYKNYLETFVQVHKDLYDNYTKQLKSLPKGTITGRRYKDTFQYYQLIKNNGTYIRRGIGKNDYLKSSLARKEYLQKALPIVQANIKALETALSNYQVITPDIIISKMSEVYRSLPTKYYVDKLSSNSIYCSSEEDKKTTAKLQQWMDSPFDQSTYKPHEKIHTTSRNLKVRTKSELIIAEILYMYNIAFHYEERIYINGRRFAPDFTIKLPNGKTFYWEHVGLTNDKSYMYDHYDKLRYYQYKDIAPWKNLILTYDNELGDLNTQIIHSEIKNKLLT